MFLMPQAGGQHNTHHVPKHRYIYIKHLKWNDYGFLFEAVSKSLGKFSGSNRKLILTVVVMITTIIILESPLPTKTAY
jgi:hypothetical protein